MSHFQHEVISTQLKQLLFAQWVQGGHSQKTNITKQMWEGIFPAHYSIVDMNLNLFCRKNFMRGKYMSSKSWYLMKLVKY